MVFWLLVGRDILIVFWSTLEIGLIEVPGYNDQDFGVFSGIHVEYQYMVFAFSGSQHSLMQRHA